MLSIGFKRLTKFNFNPPQLLAIAFILSMVLGTILLKLPIATSKAISWVDALFTATSAITVTGLITVDTGSVYTLFGEIVILVLIQLGGLGVMTIAVLIYILLGKKIGMRQRLIIQQALNQPSVGGVIRLVKKVVYYSLVIEGAATCFLALDWGPQFGWGKGIYYSIFHSVSAFNNAGFSIWSNNLMSFVNDPVVNIVITILFIMGGVGFTVLAELWGGHDFHRLSLHTKLMVTGTVILSILSMIVVFILEYDNPNTIGPMSTPGKIWASYFQAVTPRTAGFNTLDTGGLSHATQFFIMILMFIGAGSASTGGGIKLTTFIVLLLSTLAFLQGRKDITVFQRTIKFRIVQKSLALTMLSMLFVSLSAFILTITEHSAPFLEIMFEVISAFGTVGLSMGLTPELSVIGKLVVVIIMFCGKIGPLTLAFSFAKSRKANIRYPESDVLTG